MPTPTTTSPISPTSQRPPVLAVAGRGVRALEHPDGDPGERQVDDRAEAGDDALGDRLLVLRAALADGGLEGLPQGQGDHADDGDHQHGLAERLAGQALQGAGLVALALRVAQGDLQGQPGEEQMDDAVHDEAAAGEIFERFTVGSA
jgi:hypothetical protein